MAITIRIPTALRKLAGGLDKVSAEAGTVREVIAALGVSHPALAAQLLDEAGNLRSFVNLYANEDSIKELNGLDKVSAEAGTVREVIAALGVSHPALAAQLLDEAGNLRSFVNLYANEDSIKELNGLDTVLKSGDDLSIVPAIAGG